MTAAGTADERAVSAWLRGPAGPLSESALAAARRHRVHLLIADALATPTPETGWADTLRRELRTAAVLHARREDLLRTTLAALNREGIGVLLLKGAGVGYFAYTAPHLRPRVDTNLLIRRESLAAADAVLGADGWVRAPESDAELASTQWHYAKPLDGSGREEHLDLHWRVANPPAFAGALSFDELATRAVPLTPLGPAALTLSRPDALFLACLHLVAHHGDDLHLIWLVDIERLAGLLDADGRRLFWDMAAQKAMRGVCRHALDETTRWLGGEAAAAIAAGLPEAAGSEPSAEWLRGRSRAARLRTELAALGSWRDRALLIREHLFPSVAYLKAKYPRCPSPLLPAAALYRIVAGAPAWLRSTARLPR